jgi:hypothetical protein
MDALATSQLAGVLGGHDLVEGLSVTAATSALSALAFGLVRRGQLIGTARSVLGPVKLVPSERAYVAEQGRYGLWTGAAIGAPIGAIAGAGADTIYQSGK